MCTNQNTEQPILTDTPYIQNETLPIWIVTIDGWGDPDIEQGQKRMKAYKTIADKWEINIEFSSRLGTLTSYKYAPSVAKEIMEHNKKTFATYEKKFGKNWQQKFSLEVNEYIKTQ